MYTMFLVAIIGFCSSPFFGIEQDEKTLSSLNFFKILSRQDQNINKSYFEKVTDYLESPVGIEATFSTIFSATITIGLTYWIMKMLKSSNDTLQLDMQIYYPEEISTRFTDVAGLAGAKADMQDIILYLQNPDRFHLVGAQIPKGVLMNGSAGNGKTLLAKAVAGEVDCPFISSCGSTFEQMYVGVGALHVRELFATARRLAGKYGACIIFIDEIDALAGKRSAHSGDKDHGQTVAQLLQCMDGLEEYKNPVIVIGATNRIETLDHAVIRPGRFDRIVNVTKPCIKDRVELISIILEKGSYDPSLNIERLARMTGGFSGAELTHLMNEAAILATVRYSDYIELQDLELAFDHITLGREILGMQQSDATRWKTAIHEAGHAAGWLFGNSKKYIIHKASIIPRAHTLGVVYVMPLLESYESTEEEMRAMITVCLCGGLAEQAFGFGKSTGVCSDLAKARSIAYDMVVKYGMSEKLNYLSYDEIDVYLPNDIATEVYKEVQKIVEESFVVAKKLINFYKNEIEAIASLLMEKGTLLGDEIYELVGLPCPDEF